MFDHSTSIAFKLEEFVHALVLGDNNGYDNRSNGLRVLLSVAEQRGYQSAQAAPKPDRADSEYKHGEGRLSDGKIKFGTIWLNPQAFADADSNMKKNMKLQAIKTIRKDIGIGLIEAKNVVDAAIPFYPPCPHTY